VQKLQFFMLASNVEASTEEKAEGDHRKQVKNEGISRKHILLILNKIKLPTLDT
jgi:hypothetical protein